MKTFMLCFLVSCTCAQIPSHWRKRPPADPYRDLWFFRQARFAGRHHRTTSPDVRISSSTSHPKTETSWKGRSSSTRHDEVTWFFFTDKDNPAVRELTSQKTTPSTPQDSCGESPIVEGAVKNSFRADQTAARVEVVVYMCQIGWRMVDGDGLIYCQENKTWSPPPKCISVPVPSPTKRPPSEEPTTTPYQAPAIIENSTPQCKNMEELDTSECNALIKYRYDLNQRKCKAIAVCEGTPIGGAQNNIFPSKSSCLRTCSPNATAASLLRGGETRHPLRTVVPLKERKSGGSTGPRCISNVDRTKHSSCLPNSTNTLETFSFNIVDVLDSHNLYRRFVSPRAKNMKMLQWDEDLAITAERWAAQCKSAGESDPTARTVPRLGNYTGQNLCLASGSPPKTWKECIGEWASQVKNWDYATGAKDGDRNSVKKFVQIIWGQARRVGCGYAQCRNSKWDYVMVCNYDAGPVVTDENPNPCARPYLRA